MSTGDTRPSNMADGERAATMETPARILIVEDEGVIALDIQMTLQRLGYVALAVATRGEDALAKAADLHPDLVLMDIRLKGDLDGVQVAEQVRERFDIPVIY